MCGAGHPFCTTTLRGVRYRETAGEATTRKRTHGVAIFDRGAALVELAFALPLVLMLILGMISAGIAFNHQLALTHAAREGGRYAATLPVTNFLAEPDPMTAWLDAVALQVINDATGSLGAGIPGHMICVAYVSNGSTAADTTTARRESGGAPAYNSTPCLVDGRPAEERRVQVTVERNTDFSVVFYSSTLTLDSEAVNRFEAFAGS